MGSPKAERALRVYAVLMTLIAIAKVVETIPKDVAWPSKELLVTKGAEEAFPPRVSPEQQHATPTTGPPSLLLDDGTPPSSAHPVPSIAPPRAIPLRTPSSITPPFVAPTPPVGMPSERTPTTAAPPLSVHQRIGNAFALGNREGTGPHRIPQPYGAEGMLAGLFRGHRPIGLGVGVAFDGAEGPLQSSNATVEPSPRPQSSAHRIAVCFFGLVKNISPRQIDHFRRNLLLPLQRYLGNGGGGGAIDVYLHTFNVTNFSNPRNGEAGAAINQRDSVSALRHLFSEASSNDGSVNDGLARGPHRREVPLHDASPVFQVVTDPPAAGDGVLGSVPSLLRNGNPWGSAASLSVLYYARQLFSLLRVTEMWSGVSMRDAVAAQSNNAVPPPADTVLRVRTGAAGDRAPANAVLGGYRCVVYTRSDVLVGTPLPAQAIRVACGDAPYRPTSGHNEHRAPQNWRRHPEIVVSTFEHGGLNDRFAIGTPEAMLLYGVRGLRLRRYVAQKHQPHAERFLGHFLCENNVSVHLANIALQRLRTTGGSPDPSPAAQTAAYRARLIPLWSAWLLQAAQNEREEQQRRAKEDAVGQSQPQRSSNRLLCCAPESVMFDEPQ